MPLSEDEQRILQEIEQQLYASDPQLARDVSSTTIYRHAGRNLKWAALGFVLGLAADAAPAPAREAARVLGELEAALASLHRAHSSAALARAARRAGPTGSLVADQESAQDATTSVLRVAWSAVGGDDFRRRLAEVAGDPALQEVLAAFPGAALVDVRPRRPDSPSQ